MLYKTILINLKKDTNRLEFMTNQLNELGILFERFEAVNGVEYLEKFGKLGGDSEYDEKEAIEKGEFGRPFGPGYVGCSLSHKRCYQKFLTEWGDGVDYCLIFEDGVSLSKDFKEIIEKEMRENLDRKENERWNYLQFDYPKNNFNIFAKYKLQYSIYKSIKNKKAKIKRLPILILAPIFTFIESLRMWFLSNFKKGVHPVWKRVPPNCGAYIVDRRVTQKFVKENEKIIHYADYLTNFVYKKYGKNFNFSIYYPKIARQYGEKFSSSLNILNDNHKNL